MKFEFYGREKELGLLDQLWQHFLPGKAFRRSWWRGDAGFPCTIDRAG